MPDKGREPCPGRPMTAGQQYDRRFFKCYGGRFNQYWWARRFYANLIKRYRDSGKLLEIGCGLGHVLMRLEDRFETYGIDVSEYAIQQARLNSPRSILRVASAEEVGSLPGPFDVIAAFHVVEHLRDPERVLKDCASITRPGGLLVLATPNPEAPFAKRKGSRWYAARDASHISIKRPAEWIEMTRQARFATRKAFGDGMWDVPYVPLIPPLLQLLVFGLPGALQAATSIPFIPLRLGESLILVAERE
jgi:2-polyprenyl-3-methyl-5-hydroxy-6-metoxy-1,4-benzoquinol methylase